MLAQGLAQCRMEQMGGAVICPQPVTPIRINHATLEYAYIRTMREGLPGPLLDREIPLPGLEAPRSQLAVPLRARGRTVGALLVESDKDQFFSYDDEDALALLCGQLAQALAALQAAELEVPPRPEPPPGPLWREGVRRMLESVRSWLPPRRLS